MVTAQLADFRVRASSRKLPPYPAAAVRGQAVRFFSRDFVASAMLSLYTQTLTSLLITNEQMIADHPDLSLREDGPEINGNSIISISRLGGTASARVDDDFSDRLDGGAARSAPQAILAAAGTGPGKFSVPIRHDLSEVPDQCREPDDRTIC